MLYRLSYPGFWRNHNPVTEVVLYYKLLLPPPLLLASNKNMVRLVQGNVVNICIGSETGLPEEESRTRGATVARLTPDQKVACSNHVGVKKLLLFHGLFNNKISQRRLSNKKINRRRLSNIKTPGPLNLKPLLNFQRLWWNIQTAQSAPFMTFRVSETRAAVFSGNAKAGTDAHSGLSNSTLYSRQISGQGSYPNNPLVLAIEHTSEFKANARTGTCTLDPQLNTLLLYR